MVRGAGTTAEGYGVIFYHGLMHHPRSGNPSNDRIGPSLWDWPIFLIRPGNELPGYYHFVPAGHGLEEGSSQLAAC
jgi:hypothetical protein